MSSIPMSQQIESHAAGRSRIALVALDGDGSAWVLDGGGSEDSALWTLPSATRGRGETAADVLQCVAVAQIGARARCVRPLQAVSGVADTAFFVGWVPVAIVTARAGARLCKLAPNGLPPELRKALGKDADEPDIVPHVRALATLAALSESGYGNLTFTSWTDAQGWHMEIIPVSLIDLHGHSFTEIMSGFKASETLRPDALDEWHRALAEVGQRPIQHHGASNPNLFGLGAAQQRPHDVAKELKRAHMAACMAGYGHHYGPSWVPRAKNIANQARRHGPPELRWEGHHEVSFSWEGVEREP